MGTFGAGIGGVSCAAAAGRSSSRRSIIFGPDAGSATRAGLATASYTCTGTPRVWLLVQGKLCPWLMPREVHRPEAPADTVKRVDSEAADVALLAWSPKTPRLDHWRSNGEAQTKLLGRRLLSRRHSIAATFRHNALLAPIMPGHREHYARSDVA
eukprot:COSAG06_NODE_3474_length_5289_cov_33.769750_4_plen_155_part_00